MKLREHIDDAVIGLLLFSAFVVIAALVWHTVRSARELENLAPAPAAQDSLDRP